MSETVLFDLGNTLVRYYRKEEFVPILEKAIENVHSELLGRNLLSPRSKTELVELAIAENREANDYSFTPMAERFERIFGVSITEDFNLSEKLCSLFLEPIFETAYLYPDTVNALITLRNQGIKLGIISNLPWGSPASMWRLELERLGLAGLVDDIVLCADVGWRKPAPQIFERAMRNLDTPANKCTFVGDDPTWDVRGSEEIGMRPVLIDRENLHQNFATTRIRSLDELNQVLGT